MWKYSKGYFSLFYKMGFQNDLILSINLKYYKEYKTLLFFNWLRVLHCIKSKISAIKGQIEEKREWVQE